MDCALALRKINTKPRELSLHFQCLQIPLTHPTQLVHWLRLFRTERCRNKATAPTSVFVLGIVLFPHGSAETSCMLGLRWGGKSKKRCQPFLSMLLQADPNLADPVVIELATEVSLGCALSELFEN